MIRINDNKLIIEINCRGDKPLERLANMQTGLLNLFGVIDSEAPMAQVQDGLKSLTELLKEMTISDIQSSVLNKEIENNVSLKEKF